jgi:DNA topoisomerase-2
VKLSNRAKYILGNLDGTIDLRRKSSSAVHDLLVGAGFALIDGDFKYLVKMPMDSVTQENVEKILKEKDDAEKELALLEKTTLEAMWLSELGDLRTAYLQYKSVRESIQKGDVQKKVVKKKMVKKVKK